MLLLLIVLFLRLFLPMFFLKGENGCIKYRMEYLLPQDRRHALSSVFLFNRNKRRAADADVDEESSTTKHTKQELTSFKAQMQKILILQAEGTILTLADPIDREYYKDLPLWRRRMDFSVNVRSTTSFHFEKRFRFTPHQIVQILRAMKAPTFLPEVPDKIPFNTAFCIFLNRYVCACVVIVLGLVITTITIFYFFFYIFAGIDFLISSNTHYFLL